MKIALASKLLGLGSKLSCMATIGAVQANGILLAADASGLKTVLDSAVYGFGGILALKGISTLSEGQGEQSAAAKAQGWGFIGGGVVLIICGLAVVNYLFDSIG